MDRWQQAYGSGAGWVVAASIVGSMVGCRPARVPMQLDTDTTFFYRSANAGKLKTGLALTRPRAMSDLPEPHMVGEWTGESIDVTPPVVQPDHIAERVYSKGTRDVWMQLIIATKAERQLHVPTICYWNDGWKLPEQSTQIVPVGTQKVTFGKLVATKPGQPKLVELHAYFWRDRRAGIGRGCTQIRVATNAQPSVEAATDALSEFLGDFLHGVRRSDG